MQTVFTVPKLACSACVETISQAIRQRDPQAQLEADLKTKQVVISCGCSPEELRQVLTQVGYPPA